MFVPNDVHCMLPQGHHPQVFGHFLHQVCGGSPKGSVTLWVCIVSSYEGDSSVLFFLCVEMYFASLGVIMISSFLFLLCIFAVLNIENHQNHAGDSPGKCTDKAPLL